MKDPKLSCTMVSQSTLKHWSSAMFYSWCQCSHCLRSIPLLSRLLSFWKPSLSSIPALMSSYWVLLAPMLHRSKVKEAPLGGVAWRLRENGGFQLGSANSRTPILYFEPHKPASFLFRDLELFYESPVSLGSVIAHLLVAASSREFTALDLLWGTDTSGRHFVCGVSARVPYPAYLLASKHYNLWTVLPISM